MADPGTRTVARRPALSTLTSGGITFTRHSGLRLIRRRHPGSDGAGPTVRCAAVVNASSDSLHSLQHYLADATVVVHHQRLAEALPLVVAPADPDRIDVAPVRFRLRMDTRLAVHLRSGRLQDSR